MAHLSLLGLRIRQPDLKRPFKIGWNLRFGRFELPVSSMVGLLGTLAVWVDVVLTKPAGRNLGFLWMGVGIVMYLWYRRTQRLSPTARVELDKLRMPDYQEVHIKKILVPRAFAGHNEIMQFAARLARDHGAKVTALHVIEIPSALPLDTFFPEKLAVADMVMEQSQAIAREFEIPISTQIKQSRSASDTIVEIAKEDGYDLIIVGAAKAGGTPGRPILGSTTEAILRNAPCRVMVFRGQDVAAHA